MSTYQIIFCSCPNSTIAETIARTLVESRLAACVNMIPAIQSIYRWEEKVVSDNEILLIIKSTYACFAELSQTITHLHPYAIPEIVSVEVNQGSKLYLNWLSDNCKTVSDTI